MWVYGTWGLILFHAFRSDLDTFPATPLLGTWGLILFHALRSDLDTFPATPLLGTWGLNSMLS